MPAVRGARVPVRQLSIDPCQRDDLLKPPVLRKYMEGVDRDQSQKRRYQGIAETRVVAPRRRDGTGSIAPYTRSISQGPESVVMGSICDSAVRHAPRPPGARCYLPGSLETGPRCPTLRPASSRSGSRRYYSEMAEPLQVFLLALLTAVATGLGRCPSSSWRSSSRSCRSASGSRGEPAESHDLDGLLRARTRRAR